MDKDQEDMITLESFMNALKKEQIILFSLDEAKRLILKYELTHLLDKDKLIRSWAKGEIKMSEAKKAILEIHALSKKTTDKALIAIYHAIGQAYSVIHTRTHQLGLVIYELSSILYGNPMTYKEEVKALLNYYHQRLTYFKNLKIERYYFQKFIKTIN